MSRPHGIPSVAAGREPARPASARAIAASAWSNGGVRLENGDVKPGICSVNVIRGQRALPHLNRRTRATIRTCRPAGGQSASDRSYPLWTRDERQPQPELAAAVATGRTKNVTAFASAWIRSIVTASRCGRRVSKSCDMHADYPGRPEPICLTRHADQQAIGKWIVRHPGARGSR